MQRNVYLQFSPLVCQSMALQVLLCPLLISDLQQVLCCQSTSSGGLFGAEVVDTPQSDTYTWLARGLGTIPASPQHVITPM